MSSHADAPLVQNLRKPARLPQAPDTTEWHDDRAFLRSLSGRLTMAITSFALIGAASLALLGTPSTALVLIPAITLVCVVGGLLATGLAIDRHGTAALAMVLSGPFVVGTFFASSWSLVGAGLPIGLALLVAALLPATLAVRGMD